MPPNEKLNSQDILGVKSFGDAINTATKGLVNGAGAFLSRICLPASEEFGLFLKDKVSKWSGENALQIEKGSWVDDNKVQDMWAGLLASSCNEDGRDECFLR